VRLDSRGPSALVNIWSIHREDLSTIPRSALQDELADTCHLLGVRNEDAPALKYLAIRCQWSTVTPSGPKMRSWA
jgi:hypothetical protein